MTTDFAFKLRSFLAIIVVDIAMRGTAEGTNSLWWNLGRVSPVINRGKGFAVSSLVFQ
jgi:hypothetical protein